MITSDRSTPAVEFQGVTKSFVRHNGRILLREKLQHLLAGRQRERFFALKNISFRLGQGEGLAVVGANGAGKSTLLNLVAGIARPDCGSIRVNGRIAPLLDLGSGFHPDLTGAENIVINASVIGLSRRRTSELFDQIVEFAEIGDFLNEPIRTYSSGMMMRLAFSVAINMDPEILLIDEVLSVGDAAFAKKSFERILRFRAAGHTILCVSHALATIPELCNQAIWLDHGQLMMSGPVREVIGAYQGRQAAVQHFVAPA
jgi:ABC-type polysaccharide/polyol phosphate transport system ATPase subunit